MYQDLTGTTGRQKGGCSQMPLTRLTGREKPYFSRLAGRRLDRIIQNFSAAAEKITSFSLSGCNFLTKEKEVSYEAAMAVQERKMKAATAAREAARRCLTAGGL